jgi:membrane-associated phospholipid phosphatase
MKNMRNNFCKINKFYLIAISLLISWALFPSLWTFLDKNTFFLLNKAITSNYYVQMIIAFFNSRYGDWIYEGSVLLTFLILLKNKDKRKQTLFAMLFLLVSIIVVQVGINWFFCRKILVLSGKSPSLTLPLIHDLSSFSFPNNRIGSNHSFPSDHATTLFLCTFFAVSFLEKIPKIFIGTLSILFALPRLMVGAHWLSDVVIGGLAIAFFSYAFAIKPLFEKVLIYIKKIKNEEAA